VRLTSRPFSRILQTTGPRSSANKVLPQPISRRSMRRRRGRFARSCNRALGQHQTAPLPSPRERGLYRGRFKGCRQLTAATRTSLTAPSPVRHVCPARGTFAQQGRAADCIQPALLRRFGFQQRLTPSVRRQLSASATRPTYSVAVLQSNSEEGERVGKPLTLNLLLRV